MDEAGWELLTLLMKISRRSFRDATSKQNIKAEQPSPGPDKGVRQAEKLLLLADRC